MADEKKEEAKKTKLPKGRHRSAIKRHRQSLERAERNRSVISAMRTAMKKVRQATAKKDKTEIQNTLRNAMSDLHKAAARGIIRKGHAARHIARLSKLAGAQDKSL